jgi:hypothetical protein
MMTLGGRLVAIVPPGPSAAEIAAIRNFIERLHDDGVDREKIPTVVGQLCSERFAKRWDRVWSTDRGRRYGPETTTAIISRIVDALLGRSEARPGARDRDLDHGRRANPTGLRARVRRAWRHARSRPRSLFRGLACLALVLAAGTPIALMPVYCTVCAIAHLDTSYTNMIYIAST